MSKETLTTSRISSARSRLRLITLIALAFIFAPDALHAGQPDPTPDLTIFFSSDTRGMLRRCGCSEGQQGGLSARASYIKKNLTAGRTLVLDAGDTLFDNPDMPADMREFYALKSRTMLKAMKESGYAAAAVGEYDLAGGQGFLEGVLRETPFPMVCANLFNRTPRAGGRGFKASRPFPDLLYRDVDGIKVGITAVIDNTFPYKSFQAFDSRHITDPVSASNTMTRKMRPADLVIILAHLSVTDALQFTKSVPGADIVIEGHSQELLDKPVVVGNTLLVKGFDKGKHIGRLDLWLSRDKDGRVARVDGKRIRDYKYQVITLDESVPPDPEVENIVADYRLKLKDKAFAFNRPEPEGAGRYVGPGRCRTCHRSAYGNWSSTGHANAFASLEKTGDQYDPECLSCHVTGYGFVSGYKAGAGSLGEVTCESCHGRGSGHAESGRKVIPGPVPEKTCLDCHDDYQSPNFEFEKYKAMGGAHRGK